MKYFFLKSDGSSENSDYMEINSVQSEESSDLKLPEELDSKLF